MQIIENREVICPDHLPYHYAARITLARDSSCDIFGSGSVGGVDSDQEPETETAVVPVQACKG